MQCTANCHHHVAYPLFPHPDGLFERATTFDPALDLFDASPSARHRAVVRFLFGGQLVSAWLLRGLEARHTLQRAPWKAQGLQHLTPRRQRIRRRIGPTLVVDAARSGLTQEHDAPWGIEQEQIVQPRPLVLAALTRFLCRCVWGARDGALGAVMTKRGATAGGAVWTVADGANVMGSSPSSPSRWWRQASTRRHGASPQVRKVLRNPGSKTCIHWVAVDWRMPNQRPCSR